MNLEDTVVGSSSVAVFGSTQHTVITKWIMEEVAWDIDVITNLDLPDDGKL